MVEYMKQGLEGEYDALCVRDIAMGVEKTRSTNKLEKLFDV